MSVRTGGHGPSRGWLASTPSNVNGHDQRDDEPDDDVLALRAEPVSIFPFLAFPLALFGSLAKRHRLVTGRGRSFKRRNGSILVADGIRRIGFAIRQWLVMRPGKC